MSAADRFGRARDSEGLAKSVAMLRNRWLIVVGVVAACVLISIVHHERGAKSYSATANVAFQSGTLSDSALQVSPSGTAEPQREADTEVLIAHSPEVAQGVRRRAAYDGASERTAERSEGRSSAQRRRPERRRHHGRSTRSARLANAFAEQYIAFRTRSQLAGIETAQEKLTQQIAALPAGSAERATLEQSLQRLGELRAVAGGGANIIGLATPVAKPTGPSLTSTILVGLLIGLAIAFSLVFLWNRSIDASRRSRSSSSSTGCRCSPRYRNRRSAPPREGSRRTARAVSHPAQRA